MTLSKELEKEVERLMSDLDLRGLEAHIRAAMLKALEAAVQVCEDEADAWGGPLSSSSDGKHSAEHCADAIRAMMNP